MKINRISGPQLQVLLFAFVATTACSGDVIIGGGSEPEDAAPNGSGGQGLFPGPGGESDPKSDCSLDGAGGGVSGPQFIEPSPSETNQVDILFVVDNSFNSRRQHEHFIEASTEFIDRLARPYCKGTTEHVSADGACPDGSEPEFSAATDLHVGVITTSLGLQPGVLCSEGETSDRAHLIPKVRPGVDDPTGSGFVSYGGDPNTLEALKDQVKGHIEAVGDQGCGYESPLEAAYRFLVDPAPFESLVMNDRSQSTPLGIDDELLSQRAAFLRPESAVVVVLLTSEDDCSIMGGDTHYENASFGWLTSTPSLAMREPTRQCAEDPNDPCCMSCFQADAEACDSSCEDRVTIPREDDPASLRCFDQKRRFGVDLLYPKERYIDAFSKPVIPTGVCGDQTPNPLFVSDGEWTRSSDKVFLTSIVGAPWQDLSTLESHTDADTLEYLSPSELSANSVAIDGQNVSRWDLLVGNPAENQAPYDPFMVGSFAPRSGTHPLVPASITGPDSASTNPINGHEYDTSVSQSGVQTINDLQYACISPLSAPLACKSDDFLCECAFEPDQNRPICKADPQADLPAQTTQYFAGAHPAPRILEVTRGLGDQGVPASICAKSLDPESPAYGYRPAMNATLSRMTPVLGK